MSQLTAETIRPRKRHGQSRTPTYRSWISMISRCTCPTASGYRRYGGRGISVCERWLNSFAAFLSDMGERPDGHTLDRLNSNGNYEPGNCRWATPKQQAETRRPVSEWSARPGQKNKTHCVRGHEMTPENTRVANGHRSCRECHRAYDRNRRRVENHEIQRLRVRLDDVVMQAAAVDQDGSLIEHWNHNVLEAAHELGLALINARAAGKETK